ncbi:hypothetical protein K1720_00235 [Thermococcus argininiproducens]|uniref:Uncharacterized protein n=1 Tax=Thermococcus argininiproducens TaxID=2866384 RepID=A0A9E7M9S9_9EURY|nr:hypothetical protein [Thermococcus argininiproducens]USG99955.1 hypothetical protein K1720_00235 [Thermococcus argininiproducens]
MKVEGAYPITSGKISMLSEILAIVFLVLGAFYLEKSIFVWVAIIFFIFSSGTGVESRDNLLILKYPLEKVKIPFDEIREVMLASELKGVVLFKYTGKKTSFPLILLVVLFITTSWTEPPITFLTWMFSVWIAFLLVIFLPVYTLRENFGKIFLTSLGVSMAVSIFIIKSIALGLLSALTFLIFMVFYVMVDYVIIATEKETFVISCLNGKRLLQLLRG